MSKRFIRLRRFAGKTIALISIQALAVSIPLPSQASVALPASVALYISAPFVQGSSFSGPGVLTESFNQLTPGPCPSVTAIGSLSGTGCVVTSGATSPEPNGEPAIGGALTQYAGSSGSMNSTFTFTNPVNYVGLWWMMGSSGNTVQFLNASNTVVAELSSADIVSFFGVSYSSLTNSDTGTVNRIDGGTHARRHYFRSPGNYTGTTTSPVMDYNTSNFANEPWVYLNLFVAGDASITKLRLAGSNFEYDNITIATQEAAPRDDMVFLRNVLGTPPTTQTLSWAPTNTTADFSNGPLIPNQLATVTSPVSGGGNVSYSVINAGSSGCTVNAATGVMTATGAGTCQVRATAASNASYFVATKDATFTFTANPPGSPTAPTAVAGDSKATVAVTSPSSGGAPSTFLITATPGGNTCTVTSPASSCEVTGLTNGTSYTFVATATNNSGTSAASSASNAVTPAAPALPAQPPATATPYYGPIPHSYGVGCLAEGESISVTLTGERLHSITSGTVDGKSLVISDHSKESMKLLVPALAEGTYDINFDSTHGQLIHQGALKVCARVAASSTPITPSVSAPVIQTKPFYVTERFTAFKGDMSPVFEGNRSAIERFVAENPGLTRVTCVGSTSGPAIPVSDIALAKARAENVCKILRELVPGLQTRISTQVGKGTGRFFRAVSLYGAGVRD